MSSNILPDKCSYFNHQSTLINIYLFYFSSALSRLLRLFVSFINDDLIPDANLLLSNMSATIIKYIKDGFNEHLPTLLLVSTIRPEEEAETDAEHDEDQEGADDGGGDLGELVLASNFGSLGKRPMWLIICSFHVRSFISNKFIVIILN